MAGSLKSLAGATFQPADAILSFHRSISPEEAILDRYVLLPHARTGIAAALSNRFAWELPARAKVEIKVPVIDDGGTIDAEMTVNVNGPADVTEIDPRQVIRAFPKIDAGDAEIDDLVHVEFDRPDLPWLFTPAGPDAAGRLVPWITLVVAERSHVEWGERRGATRIAAIRRDQLQPLQDAWAWAHAQVIGPKLAKVDPVGEPEPTLARRLSDINASQNLSRLVCPRRLDDRKYYVACVVPTFLCGRQAGLGLPWPATLEPAWGTAANFKAGDPESVVRLPVYYSWSFGTGEKGNFESLARNLRPRVAPPGVGRRRVDATHPWTPAPVALGDPGAEIVVKGPVVSPQDPEKLPERFPDEHWPSEQQQHWPPPVTDELVARLNNPDEQAHTPKPDPGPPLVGPPLYGSNHARQPRIETEAAAAAAQPPWFRELNTDPRDRIVGGLGARVIQSEQESLVAGAWNQVVGVEAANRALRLAQLAKHVSASLHRRHVARLSDAAVLSITERVHAKVLDAPQRSVWAALDDSSLPATVTAGAFRRLARVRGPVVRSAVRAGREQRAQAVESLTVRAEDRRTTDWVLQYTNPDGIGAVSELAKAQITDEIAERVAPGTDRETLLASWDDELPRPAPSDHLTPDALAGAQPPAAVDVRSALAASLMRRLLGTLPLPEEIEADPELVPTALLHVEFMRSVLGSDVELSRARAEQLGLDVEVPAEDPTRVRVSAGALRRLAARTETFARQFEVSHVNQAEITASVGRLREILGESGRLAGPTMLAGFEALAANVVVDDPFVDKARARIDALALALALVARLDPARTLPARVKGRLTTGSGRLPGWLRPDWFDDQRIEPVMAHPRFHEPMYKPLHRYDREWMVPGLGLISRPDMATLLETNNRFIEAYLVGLNHEMGRELLWREYPTDQRGTYFDSFWTGQRELVADLHEPAWHGGDLGRHMQGEDGQIVFLVRGDLIRRYPGVVAHAVRQATDEHGLMQDNGIPLFEFTDGASPVKTLFHVHLAPNVLLVGFDMKRARIGAAGETWWFTLSENPTEPRFGLDSSRVGAISRDNLVWTDFGLDPSSDVPGQFLDALAPAAGVRFESLEAPLEFSTWGASSAEVARLLFQLPARAAFLGTKMVDGAVNP